MTSSFLMAPIGFVRGGRRAPEDDGWGSSRARIELNTAQFTEAAFLGLGEFSHVEVLFVFDRADPGTVETGARRPRGRADWPLVGIFAQRAKDRPNRIGLCICQLVEVLGAALEVEGLDAIDGTPVLDIKPVMAEFLPRTPVRQPPWSHDLMSAYW